MRSFLLFLIVACLFATPVIGQEVIALYEGAIPNSKAIPSSITESFASGMYRNTITPTLEVYLPEKEKATGAAVVICPGGGYSVIVYSGEGISVAKQLAKNGVAAFILKYRLPNDLLQVDKKNAPLQDALQAMKLVKKKAVIWGLDSAKVGIVGFSAGGHLAASVATQYGNNFEGSIQNISAKPAFQVLVYPVISMQDSLTHKDSRKQLLGANPTKQVIELFSNELQINAQSPPAYLTHAADDNVVDVDNSIFYFEQLRKQKVLVEMHIYPKGGHGFIFRQNGWMDPLLAWMKVNNWIK
jgi:acetyl esterase/lipase